MTRMEAPSSKITWSNDDNKNLEWLLEAFGSKASLEDIASAYYQAGHDVCEAGEILCNMQGSSSSNSTSVSNNDFGGASASSVGSSDSLAGKSYPPILLSRSMQRNCGVSQGTVSGVNGADYARSITSKSEAPKILSRSKPRNCSASLGTVSGVIGADYAKSRTSINETCEVRKPMKLMSNEFPASEIWDEKMQSDNPKRTETMNQDVEEFLLRMLGNGFQLDMQVIRDVVGGCGYDVRESLERLMNMSAPTLEISDNVSSIATETNPVEICAEVATQHEEQLQSRDSAGSFEASYVTNGESEHLKRENGRSNLQKEVLHTLFTVPERSEEGPRKSFPRREVRRTRTYGVVTGPLEDPVTEFKTPIVRKEVNGDVGNAENEDNYEVLRQAVQEYWTAMKEYYRAAADAYAKGNYARADKLLEQGGFFMDKARETNEKSAKKLLQARDDGETISIDLHDYEPKEAVRLLKTHLKSMCGIPSIHYLKIVLGANDGNTKRKRQISKLLERDAIIWTEEKDGQIMTVRVDVINPKRLTFNK